ncbi:MAG TPA: Wzz/FepE/Etk N-terminal domain-containing protein [Bacteroidales bacterium]|nr:Wzz/FepE/Etk N-terminal domain-containing protein [Bacteroidales bacterium]
MDILENEKKLGLTYIRVVLKYYRLILAFLAIACLATFIITLLIPKKYTASAVVFPTESNSLEDVIRNPQFGYDVEADRLIQLLESRTIRDSITKKYNLLSYYGIDTLDQDYYDRLKRKFNRDINFSKTIFMSVVISAKTRDPVLSANIVNSIIGLLNKTRETLLKQNLAPTVASLTREYNSLQKDLDSLSGIVDRMAGKRKGIRQYIQADRNISIILDKDQVGDDQASKALQTVVDQYNLRLSWFYDVQTRLKNSRLMMERPLPSVYVVESAIPSYRKSSPILSLNLGIALVGGFIFISFVLFFYERIRLFGNRGDV